MRTPSQSSTAREGREASRARRRRRRASGLAASVAALAAGGVAALPSGAIVIPDRTFRVASPDGTVANGDNANPAISGTGRLVAFDSSATNFGPVDENGAVRDVYTFDRTTGERLLVSRAPGGPAADGPSGDPDVSGPTRRVVFASAATNLVPDDVNGKTDVFVREGDGPIRRVSLTARGGESDGDSFQPAISDNGRFVVFASSATNLVPNDTNEVADIFIRDIEVGTTRRVSLHGRFGQSNGRSGTPAISSNGRFVSFESDATDLDGRDENGLADVFVRDVSSARTARVSESAEGEEQNAAVIQPFRQVSDISRDGRYVVFESDASNLVRGDRNRDTDVFIVDRRRDTVERASVSTSGREGDNDSFAPAITDDGRFVIFESFARNLAPQGSAREDIFVHDRRRQATILVSVSSRGTSAGPERVQQLLQQPAISNNGTVAAFISTADDLTPDDTNGVADVFVRVLTGPAGTITGSPPRIVGRAGAELRLGADDPQAGRAICRIDRGPQRECGFPTVQMPRRLREGRHRMHVFVGGPGMLFDARGLTFRFTVDRTPPRTRVTAPRGGTRPERGLRAIRGRAADNASGIRRVEVAVVTSRSGRSCRVYDGRRFVAAGCRTRRWVPASGARSWRLRLRARPRGFILVLARSYDRSGNRSRAVRVAGFIL